METNTNYNDYRQNNSGLLRFRSTSTSFLENFVGKKENLSSGFCGDGENSSVHGNSNNESGVSGFAGVNSQLPPQYPRQFSMGVDHQGEGKIGSSSLMRQNSSPAGLFSHLTSQNGYATMRGIGSYRMAHDNGTAHGDLSPSSSRLKNHMNLSSRVPRMLARITEVENDHGGLNDPKVENSSGDNLIFSSGFPFGSWNDSSNFAETFNSGIKRELDVDHDLFANTQNEDLGNRPNILSHHLSLPKKSSEMATMEKLLQFQDTVPCKLRAKRGCATHPRSIAERVRRTRISERMRKLQELVPNMDKQTNTADMLDLAVDYIKNLQKQYKTLSDNRANCKCSASR